MLSHTPLEGEFTVGTSVEIWKGGINVAGLQSYLEKVMQHCFEGRTKTTCNQTLFKMPGGCAEKFQHGGSSCPFPG